MARHQTDELKYYSRDTRMQENEQYIEAVHGPTGFYVLEKLRMHIYGSAGGYYCDFKDIHKRLFCKNNGNIPVDVFDTILTDCFLPDVELFDKTMYEKYRILTSDGIQKRWKKIVVEVGRKNTSICPDYCLIPEGEMPDNPPIPTLFPADTQGESTDAYELTGVFQGENGGRMGGEMGENGGITGGLQGETPTESTQKKRKEIKLKESKEESKEDRGELSAAPPVPTDPPPKNSGKKPESPAKSAVIARRQNFSPPTQEECVDYFAAATAGKWHVTLSRLQAQKFFNHYQSNGWVQNKDKPIVDWKAAANGWLLREVGDSSFKIERGVLQKISQDGFQQKESDPEKQLEFLYQAFLEKQLKGSKIQPCLYEYLKKKDLLKFEPGKNAEIMQQARKARANSLEGTNEASVLRLLAAYQLGKPDTEEPIKADLQNLHKEARILAIVHFFELAKDQGKVKLF